MAGRIRPRATAIVLLASVGGALVFGASPILLTAANSWVSDVDLDRMSAIGEAYGGVSALLAGGAVAGVAAALLVQIRQFKTSQAQGMRMMQIELMRMLLEDPTLRPVSPSFPEAEAAHRRRAIFTNLMFRYMELGFEIGYFPAEALESELLEQMRVGDIRKVWTEARPRYAAGAANRAQREFVRLIDRAYAASSPTVPAPAVSAGVGTPPAARGAPHLATVAGAALVGVALAVRLRKRRADPSRPPRRTTATRTGRSAAPDRPPSCP